jgi:ABC-type dipeptide/oligopeptide/nickel transport system permease subunit
MSSVTRGGPPSAVGIDPELAQVGMTMLPPQHGGAPVEPTARRRRLRALLRNKPAVVALAFLVILVLSAVFAGLLAPQDPNTNHLLERFHTPGGGHLLGTDQLGRDIFSRLIYASRVSLLAGVGSVGFALVIALPVGLVTGFVGGKVDSLLMRLLDVILSVPPLILMFAVAGILGAGLFNTIVALGVYFTPLFVRLVRGEVRYVAAGQLVEAERAIGVSPLRIMWRHVLPLVASPVIVQGSLAVGTGIIAEASLSFLGLGVQPPTPTWGVMLSDGYHYMAPEPWMVVIPAVAVALTVLALNVLGDGLRDALGRLEG